MKFSLTHIILIIALLASPFLVMSQQAVVAGGGHAKGTLGSTDFTIGQIDHITVQGKQIAMTQGMQQPYMTIVNPDSIATLPSAIIFPNPVVEKFILRVQKGDPATMKFIIHSIDGKPVIKQNLATKDTEVYMGGLQSAMYVVTLRDKKTDKILQVIKVIKIR